ncbi:MAG TPA: glycosyltransferase family 2 protein [Verrucomicrobiae bacterium]|nr:glycosyltransferase family 2 protein [Verrucomicrobiae bacterium]
MESGSTQNPLRVTVVIVTRNTSALVRAAVKSVLESEDNFVKEIVVVDNGSSDDTATALPTEFPSVKYLRSDTNLGFARANNLGAREARCDFLLLLNSDARLKPDSLQRAVDWMSAHPECGVAGAQLLNPDGSRQNSIANFPTLATELLNKSLLRRLFPSRYPGKEQHYGQPVEVESVIGAFMLIRFDAWQKIGGLDERYFFFLEETDFCLAVRRAGWKIFHLPQVEVWHEQGKSAKQTPAPARIEYWRSRYLYFAKNHTPSTCKMLRTGLRLKLMANGISNFLLMLLTFGRHQRSRSAWAMSSTVRRWHKQGCPLEWGLPR